MSAVVALVLFSCGHKSHDSHKTVGAKLKDMSVDSIKYTITSTDLLKDLETVMVNVENSTAEIFVPKRHMEIQSYECTNCHTKPLHQMQNDKESKKAHWDVQLVHGDANTMNCTTCHDGDNMNKLKSITGSEISFDHSYNQCAQCHSKQKKDWLGGAHGKRLGGWVPPRTVATCVNCHNPHKPAFESRWPARLNTVKLQQQEN